MEVYDFKSSLEHDMCSADLILSHAGAGTVTEALKLQKRLVVVINTLLMNNHQTELAHALGVRKHLYVVEKPEQLRHTDTWKAFQNFKPLPYQAGDEYDFPKLLDAYFGFDDYSKNA